MSQGPVQVFSVGVASGASTSSALDLSSKSYTRMGVTYATMSTGALVSIYGATASNSTYFPVTTLIQATATVAYQNLQIPTSSSGNWTVFPALPFEYLQFVASAVVSGGVSFTVTVCD